MRLEKASEKAIKYACMKFHYAKAKPQSLCAYSVFNNENEWCGVIIYGLGAGNKMAIHFNVSSGQCCELVRVALNGKQINTSKAISISLRLLKKDCPLIRIVYSFADLDQNHYGTIYQASNWIYLGESTEYSAGWIVKGVKRHRRILSDKLKKYKVPLNDYNVKKYLDRNAIEYISKGKRKYIQIFDKSLNEKFKALSKPYPKKEIYAAVAHLGEQLTTSQEGAFDATLPLNNSVKTS
jgi:hypothetical protein